MPSDARRCALLLRALREILRVLAADGDEHEALSQSFEAVADGFQAVNALLLEVVQLEPIQLRCRHARGRLTKQQIAACERGESVKGVSPSVIRRAVTTGNAELVRDPRLSPSARRTASLEGGDFSVLCAPVRYADRDHALAVLYFQNSGLADSYGDDDLAWIEDYAAALGQLFGHHLAERRRREELRDLAATRAARPGAPCIVGESESTRRLRRELHEVYIPSLDAPTPDPLLILGERGTGKDLVARYVHAYGARGAQPFVVASCAEISDELAASRFFGHRRGAFTGAASDEPGFFRAAQGGVLFLDEIGDLSARAQGVLLRVLENHTVVPVGETREIAVDVAVVMATNRDLNAAVREGTLRADFYDRFRMQAVRLLPLRERPWDVPALLEHFRYRYETRARKRTLGFTRDALRRLLAHSWPGNVRELARTCSLLVTHARPGATLGLELLLRCIPELEDTAPVARAASLEDAGFAEALTVFKRELILSRLARFGGRTRLARQSLGLSKSTFHRYVHELGLAGAAGEDEPSDRGPA